MALWKFLIPCAQYLYFVFSVFTFFAPITPTFFLVEKHSTRFRIINSLSTATVRYGIIHHHVVSKHRFSSLCSLEKSNPCQEHPGPGRRLLFQWTHRRGRSPCPRRKFRRNQSTTPGWLPAKPRKAPGICQLRTESRTLPSPPGTPEGLGRNQPRSGPGRRRGPHRPGTKGPGGPLHGLRDPLLPDLHGMPGEQSDPGVEQSGVSGRLGRGH
mmetsp:Transcript_11659/g.27330  ORF Transcript_11659/g.27330 Transcript_11659/m.27330 type:complete len:212 (+) Transcript_11659:282-917(+)